MPHLPRVEGFTRRLRRLDSRGTVVPPWIAPLFVVLCIGLVPWSLYLFIELPERTIAHHWSIAWGGFDIALAAGLAGTAICVVRGSFYAQLFATVTGTLLAVDAWFDVLTATGGALAFAIVTAALVEVPLAVLCFWIARNMKRVTEQSRRYLVALGYRIEGSAVVPPDGQLPEPAEPAGRLPGA